MKKIFSAVCYLSLIFLFVCKTVTFAVNPVPVHIELTPIPCPAEGGGGGGATGPNDCHGELLEVYSQRGESCAANYADFLTDPSKKHHWVEDSEVTAQGKADERARQFIAWTVTRTAIDDHPVIKSIWGNTRNIALFLILIVAALLGLGLIIGQRMQFDLRVQTWPIIFKIVAAILYITFSAAIIILLIQFSEILMKFFIENLGGKNLFNIYFSGQSEVKNYTGFVGCRDLNLRVQEGAETELTMLRLTNITYYVMGSMLLIRKILLWFLLFVAPFLAILMPFVFIRNTGWIWIGVFFQWLFYGPLFALFLGATAKIWSNPAGHIPFLFDFSKVTKIGTGVDSPAGYVYPTAINILYGGPAQTLGVRNNGNYIDTFIEYVITLLMLWAVTFFPWWLLRIFRDYCCDGIMAMKNILLSMYDQSRGGPSPKGPGPTPLSSFMGSVLKMPERITTPVESQIRETVKLERIEDVKKASTQTIMKSMQLSATKLTDIARLETNKTSRETATKNIQYLQNPIKATTQTERQQFMNVRSELVSRAVKQDRIAKQVLSTVSSSQVEHQQSRQEFVRSIPSAQKESVTHVVSVKVNMPQQQVSSVTQNFVSQMTKNTSAINTVAQESHVPVGQVTTVLQSYAQNINEPSIEIINTLEKQTGVKKDRVAAILRQSHKYLSTNKKILTAIAEEQKTQPEKVQQVLDANLPLVTEPQKNIEATIAVPPSISIEDYEEVKKMWKEQYKKGEVPVTENVKSRQEWLDQDTVFITNTLNKLVSTDDKIRAEGLDDLGYILPIFMVNNFTGEEVLVYLKAKLEAAKEVKDTLDQATAEVPPVAEEEFVDIESTQKTETQQEMGLEQSRTIDESDSEVNENISRETPSIEVPTSTSTPITSPIKNLKDIALLETKKTLQAMYEQITSSRPTEEIQGLQKRLIFKKAGTSSAVASITNLSQAKVTSLTTSLLTNLSKTSTVVSTIAKATGVQTPVVSKVLSSLANHIDTSPATLIPTVVKETGVNKTQVVSIARALSSVIGGQSKTVSSVSASQNIQSDSVTKVIKSLSQVFTQSSSLAAYVSAQTSLPAKQSEAVATSVLTNIAQNAETLSQLSSQAGTTTNQTRAVLTSAIQSINQPAAQALESITKTSNVSKDNVKKVFDSIGETKDHLQAEIATTAQKEGIPNETAEKALSTQLNLIAEPEKNVEATIPIPSSVSIEDYEEVKNMWREQYERGEVPVTENITSREEWLHQDTVFITNTLNKLFSDDEKIKYEGMNDLSYILPVFMTNNFSGEEILVYLKAKLEAAKEIQKSLEKTSGGNGQGSQGGATTRPEEFVDVSSSRQTPTQQTKVMEQSRTQAETIQETAGEKTTSNLTTKLATVTKLETERHIKEATEKLSSQEKIQIQQELTKTLTPLLSSSTSRIISSIVGIPQSAIQSVSKSFFDSVSKNSTFLQTISGTSKLPPQLVQTVLTTLPQTIDKPVQQLIPTISTQTKIPQVQITQVVSTALNPISYVKAVKETSTATNIEKGHVEEVIQSLPGAFKEDKKTLSASASGATTVSEKEITTIITTFFTEVSKIPSVVSSLGGQVGLTSKQTQNVLTVFTHHISQPAGIAIDQTAKESGVKKEHVKKLLTAVTSEFSASKDMISDVAKTETLSEDKVIQALGLQIPLVDSPQAHPEVLVPVTPAVSIEDYEEVKNMWREQYERGEVPVTENITSREEWLHQDTVFITNTLNKLFSDDEKIKYEGMNDLSYILPVFMTNNFSGEEILVYLKAKLEAAKEISEKARLEQEITARVKQETAKEYVTVPSSSQSASSSSQTREAVQERVIENHTTDQMKETKLTTVAKMETDKHAIEAAKQLPPQEQTQIQQIVTKMLTPLLSPSISQLITSISSVPQSTIQTMSKSFTQALSQSSTFMQATSSTTTLPSQTIQAILTAFPQVMNKPIQQSLSTISTQTKVSPAQLQQVIATTLIPISYVNAIRETSVKTNFEKESVEKIVHTLPNALKEEKKTISTIISSAQVSEKEASHVVATLFTEITKNPHIVTSLGIQNNLTTKQTQDILTVFPQNISQSTSIAIDETAKKTGVSKENIRKLLATASTELNESKEIVSQVAQKESLSEEKVTQALGAQVPLITSPQTNPEVLVPVTPAVSIEDYEEVKNMWREQYERGEVPVTENITSREEWLHQDTVFITNTLNKLFSDDEKIKYEGMNDLSYILPVFMTNNFSGEEILVYLKAKLEAAKEIQKSLEKTSGGSGQESQGGATNTPQEYVTVSGGTQQGGTQGTQVMEQEDAVKTVNKFTDIAQLEVTKKLQQTAQPISSTLSAQKTTTLLQNFPTTPSLVQAVVNVTKITAPQVQSLTTQLVNSLGQNNSLVQTLTQTTQLAPAQIQSIFNSFTQQVNQPVNQIINTIAAQTNIPKQTVSNVLTTIKTALLDYTTSVNVVAKQESVDKQNVQTILQSLTTITTEKAPVIKILSLKSGLSQEKTQAVTTEVISSISRTPALLSSLAFQAGLDATQTRMALTSVTKHLDQNGQNISDTIASETHIPKEKVDKLLQSIGQQYTAGQQIVKDIAQKEGIPNETAEKALSTQLNLIAEPEKNVEATIPIPSSVSIEDYEEVKNMWREQYERGEVPVTENITSREEWLHQDTVFITNTLNKLFSDDEKIKYEGMNDLSYILPVFMTNNFSGEEILVYLKAKLEAAKEISEKARLEQEITQRVTQQTSQNYVTVSSSQQNMPQPAKAQEKTIEEPRVSTAPSSSTTTHDITDRAETKLTTVAKLETGKIKQIEENPLSREALTEKVTTLMKDIVKVSSSPISQIITNITHIPQPKIQSVSASFMNALSQNNPFLLNQSQNTGLTSSQIQTIYQSFPKHIDKPANQIEENIAHDISIPKDQVSHALTSLAASFFYTSLTETTATKHHVSEESVKKILTVLPLGLLQKDPLLGFLTTRTMLPAATIQQLATSMFTTISATPTLLTLLATQTGLPTTRIQTVITSLLQNLNEPGIKLVESVAKQSNISSEKISEVMNIISNQFTTIPQIIGEVAKKEGMKKDVVVKALGTQFDFISKPKIHLETFISQPETISLEDYEEVKTMWKQQYERGEVPLSDLIHSREEWLDSDIVFITNTLNKLMSGDEKMRFEGMNDLGYILPVFMINNFTGEEILFYLKAKLEAAKEVKELMTREKQLTEKLKVQSQEVTVDIPSVVSKPEQKTMTEEKEVK